MAFIHILNVGDGDCSIIQHDDKKVTMIDCCCALDSNEENHNPSNPLWILGKLNVKNIFRYIQTHPDMDHMDGLKIIHDKFPIINFWDVDNNKQLDGNNLGRYNKEDWECYQLLRKSEKNPKSLHYTDVSSTKYFAYDDNGKKLDDYIQILSPSTAMIKEGNEKGDWNDCSYIILYCIHGRKILFCGDAEEKAISHIIKKEEIKNIDILIAPHHGRKPNNGDYTYLDVMTPKLVVCEQVEGDFTPRKEYLNRSIKYLEKSVAHDISFYIQDDGGIIIMSTNKSFVDVDNRKRNIQQSRRSLTLPIVTFVLDKI